MIPRPRQKFMAYTRRHNRPAHDGPFRCLDVTEWEIAALDASGFERTFPLLDWRFERATDNQQPTTSLPCGVEQFGSSSGS